MFMLVSVIVILVLTCDPARKSVIDSFPLALQYDERMLMRLIAA